MSQTLPSQAILQFRDLLMAKDLYVAGVKENVVPGSDYAGEIVALGSDAQGWNSGVRVCVNFFTTFLHRRPSSEASRAALGGPSEALVHVPDHLSDEETATLP
ncbi:hypothetical protein FIBSPDRAFT_1036272 [Athelia psychrophila]|uniref:Alcohol dehydrogenase-like N-terminal domain-containing protein n=1 Tax=Athelia psychrophila TaxID=1759441 RepID=A0A166VWR7_9AGAM|nr:hypothetical protein FIBSPDRAFT_1036272 [Fibularhizoctonia sp. CBS 109695]